MPPPTPFKSSPEAVRHIPDDWLANHPTEPLAQIKGIGNRIRNEDSTMRFYGESFTRRSHALKTVMQALLDRHAVSTQNRK
jgi:hypothetical protein